MEAIGTSVREALGEVPLFGPVNNAGLAPAGPLELQPAEEFREVVEENLLGAAAVTGALLSLLREARGRIASSGGTGAGR